MKPKIKKHWKGLYSYQSHCIAYNKKNGWWHVRNTSNDPDSTMFSAKNRKDCLKWIDERKENETI